MRILYRALVGCAFALTVGAPVAAFSTGDVPGLPGDINGTERNDRLIGTERDERLLGFAGDDVLLGKRGHDTGIGGGGSDVLRVGPGNDTLNGGPGRNRLYGGRGNDFFLASTGRFELQMGGLGSDNLNSYGRARLVGGPGRDDASNGPGVAHINMGDGPDSVTLDADRRPDFVNCGPGQDYLHYIGKPSENDVIESCEVLSYQD